MPIPADGYVWGSNSSVANNAMVLAVAYELTGAARYRTGALETMDYLLGRNALDRSYVTGYGERASENQHHRFWAHQNDASLPHPPAGSFAGGPDAALEDPVAKAQLVGCAPAACYVDDIGSYSTNEVAINWNASLAWLAAFAAERRSAPAASCSVAYKVDNAWGNGFTATVTVQNTGTSTVSGWTLGWSFPGDQRISTAWNATATQSGASVTARDAGWNGALAPGARASFGFQATYSGANPAPARFTLNGANCA